MNLVYLNYLNYLNYSFLWRFTVVPDERHEPHSPLQPPFPDLQWFVMDEQTQLQHALCSPLVHADRAAHAPSGAAISTITQVKAIVAVAPIAVMAVTITVDPTTTRKGTGHAPGPAPSLPRMIPELPSFSLSLLYPQNPQPGPVLVPLSFSLSFAFLMYAALSLSGVPNIKSKFIFVSPLQLLQWRLWLCLVA